MLVRGNETFLFNLKKIKKIKNSFTRKIFRILTKRILTFYLKKGGYSAFWFKIAKKLPKSASFPKSCYKLLSEKKVAQNPKCEERIYCYSVILLSLVKI